MSPQLQHFLNLARRGGNPAASGGQQRAHRLAQVVVADVNGLDQDAIQGLLEFIAFARARGGWNAQDLLDGA